LATFPSIYSTYSPFEKDISRLSRVLKGNGPVRFLKSDPFELSGRILGQFESMAMAEISCREMASFWFENRRTSIQMTFACCLTYYFMKKKHM